jgi:hypothetical protein
VGVCGGVGCMGVCESKAGGGGFFLVIFLILGGLV